MVTVRTDQLFEDIVNTIHEPLLVLDSDLKVANGNRSFFNSFLVTREETLGRFIYDVGNKQWDIPGLRELLESILPENTSFDNFEVEHDFATIGRRTMILNARQIERAMGEERVILLAIEDITERKRLEDLLQSLKSATGAYLRPQTTEYCFSKNADLKFETPIQPSRRCWAIQMRIASGTN